MSKQRVLIIVLIIGAVYFTGLGVSYALWTNSLHINNTVQTGEMTFVFDDEGNQQNTLEVSNLELNQILSGETRQLCIPFSIRPTDASTIKQVSEVDNQELSDTILSKDSSVITTSTVDGYDTTYRGESLLPDQIVMHTRYSLHKEEGGVMTGEIVLTLPESVTFCRDAFCNLELLSLTKHSDQIEPKDRTIEVTAQISAHYSFRLKFIMDQPNR